jgi:hypothetical protein
MVLILKSMPETGARHQSCHEEIPPTNGGDERIVERIIGKAKENASLADSAVPDQKQLEIEKSTGGQFD